MSWQDVRGHDRLVQAFADVAARGRLGHAYLFVGPPGVGKKLFAVELARALLCEGSAGRLAACGHCVSCKLVEGGAHPDLTVVGKPEESNELPVEVMRELCRHFSLKSARGRGKVAVLDDADDLNDAAANCFLKTLEEPPAGSLFLLVGSARDRQLPTIRSRCQVIRFAPLPEALVTELLGRQGVTDQALVARVLPLAGGSPGQALALADQELWKFRQELLQGLTRKPVNPVTVSKSWMEFVEGAGKELAAQRRLALRVLTLLMLFLRDALAHSLGETPRLNEPDEVQRLAAFTAARGPDRILELMDRCLEAETQVARYIQLVLIIEGLVDAFCE